MADNFIRDNHKYGTVASYLQEFIKPGDKLSFVSAYFTVPAYLALREHLDSIGSMRFLFGEPRFLSNLDPDHVQSKAFALRDEGMVLENQAKLRAGARQCAEWIEKNNVEIRSVIKPDFLHGKLYFIERPEVRKAITGSSNFTVNGLGLKGGKGNYELNMVVDADSTRAALLEWFNSLWDDVRSDENPAGLVADAREEVLQYLRELTTDRDPDFVYKKTLLTLFGAQEHERDEQDAETEQTLENTAIWNSLYEFQKHGVKAILSRINSHNGCILADSVGLGKTYSALAVIKYFELKASQKARVLVLCPKKLEENWRVYQAQANSKHNPFEDDAFTFTLLAHTDLARESGNNNGVNLQDMRWDNYDLVVIDESHNLRNRKGARYEKLMEEVVKKGKGTKFLLLSATPVNVNLTDLHNQVALFTGDDDLAFHDSLGIKNLKTLVKTAQKAFITWASLPAEKRNSNTLSTTLPPEFFHLLDGLSIARSRRQIQEHYADALEEIGAFPKRLKPVSIHSDVDKQGEFPPYEQLDQELSDYSLCVFKPSTYVLDEFKEGYLDTTGIANFSQENREKFLIDMMKVNFLKRLESSVFSFGQTMDRTIAKIDTLIGKLQAFEEIGAETLIDLDPDDPDADQELLEATQTGKGVKYKLEHMDRTRWIADLEADRQKLAKLQDAAGKVGPDRDAKLEELKQFIIDKVNAGDTDRDGRPDRKVLVFTAFADTAQYLYDQLRDWAKTSLNFETAVITGSSKGVHSTLSAQDFSSVLADFSPRSKKRAPGLPEIDLLIATDCISEGQNLQDCASVVNYDIHWNPVRLVQRFGRVDRIGSRHEAIGMVNFWPVPDLNQYIQLQNRVESRMALAVLTSTGDDNLLHEATEKANEKELCYRDQQLLRLKDEVVDLEEMTETVTFADFTLEEFRLDLHDFLEASRRELEEAPEGIFAVVPQGQPGPQAAKGYLFCLRRTDAKTTAHYPYAPHYVVYLSDDGKTVHSSYMNIKHSLDIWKATSRGKTEVNKALCTAFDEATSDGQDMSAVIPVLKQAVADIKGTAKKMSLNQATAGKKIDAPVLLEGFDLVTWLVVV